MGKLRLGIKRAFGPCWPLDRIAAFGLRFCCAAYIALSSGIIAIYRPDIAICPRHLLWRSFYASPCLVFWIYMDRGRRFYI